MNIDVSAIDDKIEWIPTTTLMLMVRAEASHQALTVQCFPVGKQWTVTKAVVSSGGFDTVRGAVANQELVAAFDDLQEALAAGSALAKKWLADPTE